MIPQVAASERGGAQTVQMLQPAGDFCAGLWGLFYSRAVDRLLKLQTGVVDEGAWKGAPQKVTVL